MELSCSDSKAPSLQGGAGSWGKGIPDTFSLDLFGLQCLQIPTAHLRGPITVQLPTRLRLPPPTPPRLPPPTLLPLPLPIPPRLPPPTPPPQHQPTPRRWPRAMSLHPRWPTAGVLLSLPAAPLGPQTTASLRSLLLARAPLPSASSPCPAGPLPTPQVPRCPPAPGAPSRGPSASQPAAGLHSVATATTSSGRTGCGPVLGCWRGAAAGLRLSPAVGGGTGGQA